MSPWRVLPAVAAVTLSGCANIPDVTVNYYFPRAKTHVAATQTIGCSPKKDNEHRNIRSVIAVTPTTTYSSDLDWKDGDHPRQGHLRYRSFKGMFSDGDATVTLTQDGRLSGINATSSGQGGAVLKDLITLQGAVALMASNSNQPFVENDEDLACGEIDKFSAIPSADNAKGASIVTLTYSINLTYELKTGTPPSITIDTLSSPEYGQGSACFPDKIALVPDAASKPVYDALFSQIGREMCTTLTVDPSASNLAVVNPISPLTVDPAEATPLELNKVAMVAIIVSGHSGDMLHKTPAWIGSVAVPMRETYQVPIPSPAVFGKTAFGISLSEYGSITSLHYGQTNGAPDATDAMGQLAKAFKAETAADKATEFRGQADLIAQQQRYIGCQVSPTTCK